MSETSPSLAPADVAGVWEAHSAHNQTARVELATDGTASVENFPGAVTFLDDGSADAWSDTSNGLGTWEIRGNTSGVWEVYLRTDGTSAQLTAVDDGHGLQFFVNFSDPDLKERVTFSRVDE
jgi:hypothetical protein